MVFADGAKHSEGRPGAAFFCDLLGRAGFGLGHPSKRRSVLDRVIWE
jgi:hypothetical protein